MWFTKTIYRWSVAIVLSSPVVFVSPLALRSEETPAKLSTVAASYTLPGLPIAAFQNGASPGTISNDRKILLGSIGSDLWRGPNDPEGVFWMITDRGPNGQVKVNGENRRTFPVPEFNPAILRVKVSGNAIEILETIPIVIQSGKPVTGLSNIEGRDETPYDYSGQKKLSFNPNGLDTEGLVQTATGEFWVAEEYGPSLVKVDRAGKVMKRYIPEGLKLEGADYPIQPVLPAIYGRRKINRGFEGLAISSDQKTIYAALQSPFLNPDKKTGEASRNTRILVFDIASEKVTAEYVFRFEISKDFDPGPKNSADEMKVSAAAFIKPGTLLILERTDKVARLYTVDLDKATNILGSRWDDASTSLSLEALEDPAQANITVVPKSLLVDLKSLDGMPDKIEGVAIIDRDTIAVSNDNDFDIEGDDAGKGVKNKILVISLKEPLPLPQANGGHLLSAQ